MNFPTTGGIERNTTMNLLPDNQPPTIPAPPITNPFDNYTPTDQPDTPNNPADWLLVATEEEWDWVDDCLAAWFDPSIEDKTDIADQMNQLLGVLKNEVIAQHYVTGPTDNTEIARLETYIEDLERQLKHNLSSITNVDRNALHVAVMAALIETSPGTAAAKLMDLATGIVDSVCGGA